MPNIEEENINVLEDNRKYSKQTQREIRQRYREEFESQ